MNIKWDYVIHNVPRDMAVAQDKFKKWGEEGWELISVIHHTRASDFYKDKSSDYFAFFKKQFPPSSV